MESLHQYLLDNVKIEVEKKFLQKKFKRYKCIYYKETKTGFLFYKQKENETLTDFKIGEIVRTFIYTNFGIFVFESKLTSVTSKFLELEKPSTYKRIQRRNILRANIEIDSTIEFIKNSTIIRYNAKIKNIGAGGISIDTNYDLSGIENIKVNFELERKLINVNAKIVQIRKYEKNKQAKYKVSIQFVSLSDSAFEYIVKQCMKYQLKARKKLQRGIYD